jgi:hypothetical protein
MRRRGSAARFLSAIFTLAMVAACADAPLTEPQLTSARSPARSGDQVQLERAYTPIEINSVYSGPPARPAGTIHLEDRYVFVEILDVESFLPRSASAADVRIGDEWERGTPAHDFVLIDINQDGNRDIRLRFSLGQLVANGDLDAQTTQLTVWGRDRRSNQLFRGSADVSVEPPVSGVIYGLAYMGEWPHGEQRVVRIDPVTGAVSFVATVPGVHTVAFGTSAFDPATGRFFFAGGGGSGPPSTMTRWSVNVHTGEIRSFGTLIGWPEGNEHSWEFDP